MVKKKHTGIYNTLVVDASHLAYRVFFALPNLSANGDSTQLIYGFMISLLSSIEQFPFHELIIALDKGSGRKRELYSGYKVRKPEEEPLDEVLRQDFYRQFDILVDLLTALGVRQCFCKNVEADDVIAHIARQGWVGEYAQHIVERPILILSGDHDLYSLLQDDVAIWNPHKDDIYTIEKFRDEFQGLEPKQYTDILAFMGCSGDKVPGVRGIGPGYATKLIKDYGSVDGVKTANPSKDRIVKLAQANWADVEISWKLVTFLDIEPTLIHQDPNFSRARKILFANELMSLLESWDELENLSKL